ncbi:MAG: hypothetical protein EBR23_07115, partial [Planctomycetia bacterium]|nr:hypothetical protein [Planctomycetia bacterium]
MHAGILTDLAVETGAPVVVHVSATDLEVAAGRPSLRRLVASAIGSSDRVVAADAAAAALLRQGWLGDESCDVWPIDAGAADRVAAAREKVVQAGQPEPFGTADWKELLARTDVQAVTSALPVDLHLPCYLDVLRAGKDLYAEKPMCLTLAECDTLVAAAKEQSLFPTEFVK